MKNDIFRIKAGEVTYHSWHQRGILVTAIEVQLAITEMGKRTHRLHWHMGHHRGFIVALESLRRCGPGTCRITDAQNFKLVGTLSQQCTRVSNEILAAHGAGAVDTPFDFNDLGSAHGGWKTLGNYQRCVGYKTALKTGFWKIDRQGGYIAADPLGSFIIDRDDFRTNSAWRRDNLAIDHVWHIGIDAETGRPVDLFRNVQRRRRSADDTVIFARLQFDSAKIFFIYLIIDRCF